MIQQKEFDWLLEKIPKKSWIRLEKLSIETGIGKGKLGAMMKTLERKGQLEHQRKYMKYPSGQWGHTGIWRRKS